MTASAYKFKGERIDFTQIELPPENAKGKPMSEQLRGKTVLVVDDSNTIRKSAEIFLRQGGHLVVMAEDGFDALAKINSAQPDLVFCDISMPRLDGYQTCAIIKSNPQYREMPVVMLSSKDGVFDKARGRMVGAAHYLTKPFTKEQLLEVVQRYVANESQKTS